MGGRDSERLKAPMKRGTNAMGASGEKETPFYERYEKNMTRTPRPETVYAKQERIAVLARNRPDMSFTNKGGWVIKRKTTTSRLKRAFQSLSEWCRLNRHEPIAVQHQTLKQKPQGHCGYCGVTGNPLSLQDFLGGAKVVPEPHSYTSLRHGIRPPRGAGRWEDK
jgi:hypothetical protein